MNNTESLQRMEYSRITAQGALKSPTRWAAVGCRTRSSLQDASKAIGHHLATVKGILREHYSLDITNGNQEGLVFYIGHIKSWYGKSANWTPSTWNTSCYYFASSSVRFGKLSMRALLEQQWPLFPSTSQSTNTTPLLSCASIWGATHRSCWGLAGSGGDIALRGTAGTPPHSAALCEGWTPANERYYHKRELIIN